MTELKQKLLDLKNTISNKSNIDDSVCPYCDGEGMVWDDYRLGLYHPCKCNNEKAINFRLLKSNIPPRFIDLNLDLYSPDDPIVNLIKSYSTQYDIKNKKNGLVLLGNTGSGKTTATVIIAKLILRRLININLKYISFNDYFDYLRNIENKDRYELINTCKNADILIIDDYGTQKDSEWVNEQIYSLINHRYNYMKSTFLTSNLNKKELSCNSRIYSRLVEVSEIFNVVGPDHREIKK